jgi:hypothetical protein
MCIRNEREDSERRDDRKEGLEYHTVRATTHRTTATEAHEGQSSRGAESFCFTYYGAWPLPCNSPRRLLIRERHGIRKLHGRGYGPTINSAQSGNSGVMLERKPSQRPAPRTLSSRRLPLATGCNGDEQCHWPLHYHNSIVDTENVDILWDRSSLVLWRSDGPLARLVSVPR